MAGMNDCDQYVDAIGDLIDGTIARDARAGLEAHLGACDDCRALVEDLRLIRETASTLQRHQPPPGVWPAIQQRLAAEAGSRRTAFTHPAWLAAAASLVAGVGLGVWLLTTPQARDPLPAGGNARAEDLVETIGNELALAEQHYTKAIAALEQVATAQQDVLDPATAATLRTNLAVIDGAIADTRAALRTEPNDTVARESLFDALRRKVAFLQASVAVINEMRKGNASGVARIADDKKS
jgi:hypothetical protein